VLLLTNPYKRCIINIVISFLKFSAKRQKKENIMACFYCGHDVDGIQAKGCPAREGDDVLRGFLVDQWEDGYRAGRARKPKESQHEAYLLGYERGESDYWDLDDDGF
jgi:hypothetical protein